MSFGKVKKITDRGFGFITRDLEAGEIRAKDVFFHAKDLQGAKFDDLREGDQVEFEIADTDKGPKAIGITLI